ncbi:hypothetical protein [Marinimicrobium sp. ARAG 43.8]|uniref:hypothetical protein n=1 Tax=Marinimicrobium sp. ARAG 43.8 TaxID=3418719 RepID=UPI003CF1630F
MSQPAPSCRDIAVSRQPARAVWLALVLLSGLVFSVGTSQPVATDADSGLLSGAQSIEMGAPSDLSGWNPRLRSSSSDGEPDWKPPYLVVTRHAPFNIHPTGTQGQRPSYSADTFPRFAPAEVHPPRAPPLG